MERDGRSSLGDGSMVVDVGDVDEALDDTAGSAGEVLEEEVVAYCCSCDWLPLLLCRLWRDEWRLCGELESLYVLP